mmetsp:Transcript_14644/g.31755  ORF Transcript_14644/g.31755 Transcript_14644/m.31755 type:complete len:225 (+) Transcript_14644:129-803(+)
MRRHPTILIPPGTIQYSLHVLLRHLVMVYTSCRESKPILAPQPTLFDVPQSKLNETQTQLVEVGVRRIPVVEVELCVLAGVVVTLAILTPKVTGASVSGGSSSFEGGNFGVVAVALAIIENAALAGGGGRSGGSRSIATSRGWACGSTIVKGVKVRHLQGGDALVLGKRLEGLHIRAEGGGGGGGKEEALGHHVLVVVAKDLFGQVSRLCVLFECLCLLCCYYM